MSELTRTFGLGGSPRSTGDGSLLTRKQVPNRSSGVAVSDQPTVQSPPPQATPTAFPEFREQRISGRDGTVGIPNDDICQATVTVFATLVNTVTSASRIGAIYYPPGNWAVIDPPHVAENHAARHSLRVHAEPYLPAT